MELKTFCEIKCSDKIIQAPYFLIRQCKFLTEQENCKDFKIFEVSITSRGLYDAFNKLCTINYDRLHYYDEDLDYLGTHIVSSLDYYKHRDNLLELLSDDTLCKFEYYENPYDHLAKSVSYNITELTEKNISYLKSAILLNYRYYDDFRNYLGEEDNAIFFLYIGISFLTTNKKDNKISYINEVTLDKLTKNFNTDSSDSIICIQMVFDSK